MTNEERINKVITEHLGVDIEKVKPDADIMHDLGADSLDHVELVMAVEEEFTIEIPDAEAETCATVKDIYELVSKKLAMEKTL